MTATKFTDSDIAEELLPEDEQAQLENAAPRCEACIECDAQRDNISAGHPSWDDIDELESPEALSRFPGLERTEEQHIADLDGVLARYTFDNSVPCSLKGSHPHNTGIVVRTLCSRVLAMGYQCGGKSIVGFAEIKKSVRSRIEFQSKLRTIENWEGHFRPRVAELTRPLHACHELLAVMRRNLPELARELERRHLAGARGAEVIVRGSRANNDDLPAELRDGRGDRARQLAGLQLFQKNPPSKQKLHSFLSEFQSTRTSAPPSDLTSARKLANIIRSATTYADSVDGWIREANAFFTESNLELALVALGHDNPQVSATGSGFRVSYMGRSSMLTL